MSAPLLLRLPWPPTVNMYWRHTPGGKVLISVEGREYRNECAWTAIRQQPTRRPTLRGPLWVSIVAHLPDNRIRDADNYFKAPLDALRFAGVYLDDSQIRQLCITLLPGVKKPGALEITLQELPAFPGYKEPAAPKFRPRKARAGRARWPGLPAGRTPSK